MRKAKAKVRHVLVDPVYKSTLVTKLVNQVMRDGEKSVAQRHVYSALEQVGKELVQDPLQIFLQAINNVKPNMEVRPRRIGGAAYQVPVPVRGTRKESLAIRWLVNAANNLPNSQYKTFSAKLTAEILSACKGEGGSVAKRQEMERMAEANKAFAHFKW